MINAHVSNAVAARRSEATTVRPGLPLFWMQFIIILTVVIALGVTLITAMPSSLPLSRVDNVQRVRDAVLAGDTARDPLMELAPGVTVRSSNVRGLKLDGDTYYYYFEGSDSYDPFSRGAVTAKDIDVVLRDGSGPDALVIYRIQPGR